MLWEYAARKSKISLVELFWKELFSPKVNRKPKIRIKVKVGGGLRTLGLAVRVTEWSSSTHCRETRPTQKGEAEECA